jgi:hypothetical protein
MTLFLFAGAPAAEAMLVLILVMAITEGDENSGKSRRTAADEGRTHTLLFNQYHIVNTNEGTNFCKI